MQDLRGHDGVAAFLGQLTTFGGAFDQRGITWGNSISSGMVFADANATHADASLPTRREWCGIFDRLNGEGQYGYFGLIIAADRWLAGYRITDVGRLFGNMLSAWSELVPVVSVLKRPASN